LRAIHLSFIKVMRGAMIESVPGKIRELGLAVRPSTVTVQNGRFGKMI
jgi:hypothetical protein